jgi:Domain of unknown function (DUF4304)
MDSKQVNRSIHTAIRPFLKELGFRAFTERTGWRYHGDRIDIVNFQSFNSYNAGVMNVTTFSFSVNLGCFLRYIPNHYPSAPESKLLALDPPRPKEYQCHMRRRLVRGYPDKRTSDIGIWFIDEQGSNVREALEDVRKAIIETAVKWFDQFSDTAKVIAILQNPNGNGDETHGFGRIGSPIRDYFLGYSALADGNAELARRHLLLAASTESFAPIAKRLCDDAGQANENH